MDDFGDTIILAIIVELDDVLHALEEVLEFGEAQLIKVDLEVHLGLQELWYLRQRDAMGII